VKLLLLQLLQLFFAQHHYFDHYLKHSPTNHSRKNRSKIMDEYCKNNWNRDLDKCADYVPTDYNEKKDQYQAIEAEKIRHEALQSKSEQESQRVCPLGSHLGLDDFGNQVCLDSKTNEVVGNPNTSEADLGEWDFGENGIVIVDSCSLYLNSNKFSNTGITLKY